MKLQIRAYAKINLTLDVGDIRPDGYHEIMSVVQSISLCDTLTLSRAEEGITVESDCPGLPTGGRNLAGQALALLSGRLPAGVRVEIAKKIPVAAGLGGGSSDAAAALVGSNTLFGLKLSREQLLKLAGMVGSDVPFFIYGGTALVQGRGELVERLPVLPPFWLVLVKPPVEVSTASVYASYRPIRKEPATPRLLAAVKQGKWGRILAELSNDLERVTLSLHPELLPIKDQLNRLGAEAVLMSGSGPTIFGIFPGEEEARRGASAYSAAAGEQLYVCHSGAEDITERGESV